MASVFRYRFNCTETGTTGTPEIYTHYIWDTTDPVSCHHSSPTHVFVANTVTIVDRVEEATMKVKEEDVPTSGKLQVIGECYNITCATGATQNFDITFPININLYSVQVLVASNNIGDMFEVSVAPYTTVGFLAVNANTGATGLTVTQTVIDNIIPGYFITVTDGVNLDETGQVVEINKANNYITLETPLTNSYLASSPTYIQMTVKFAHKIHIFSQAILRFGDDTIGSSYIPKNTVIRVKYWNNTGGNKKIVAYGQYLY